jgi:hypothetical protein
VLALKNEGFAMEEKSKWQKTRRANMNRAKQVKKREDKSKEGKIKRSKAQVNWIHVRRSWQIRHNIQCIV